MNYVKANCPIDNCNTCVNLRYTTVGDRHISADIIMPSLFAKFSKFSKTGYTEENRHIYKYICRFFSKIFIIFKIIYKNIGFSIYMPIFRPKFSPSAKIIYMPIYIYADSPLYWLMLILETIQLRTVRHEVDLVPIPTFWMIKNVLKDPRYFRIGQQFTKINHDTSLTDQSVWGGGGKVCAL